MGTVQDLLEKYTYPLNHLDSFPLLPEPHAEDWVPCHGPEARISSSINSGKPGTIKVF